MEQRGAIDLSTYRDVHKYADTDSDSAAIHHTLGKGPNQASPGNHTHPEPVVVPLGGVITWFFSDIPANYLECNGQTISESNYPEFFAARGLTGAGTYTLPDIQDKYVKGKGASSSAGDSAGNTNSEITLAVGDLPAHDHDIGHDHANATAASSGAHTHDLSMTSAVASLNFPPQGQGSGAISSTSSLPISTSGAHTHTVDIPAHAGNSGSTGSGNAVNIEPDSIVGIHLMRVA